MPTIIRNIAAVIAGFIIGNIGNMAIITVGPMVLPPPAGVDVTDMETLRATIHLFEPKHFITPFLAHALGTLVGVLVAYLIAGSHKTTIAYILGALFLVGGIAASVLIPAPTWYIVLDLVVAYIPMAWLAVIIGRAMQGNKIPEPTHSAA